MSVDVSVGSLADRFSTRSAMAIKSSPAKTLGLVDAAVLEVSAGGGTGCALSQLAMSCRVRASCAPGSSVGSVDMGVEQGHVCGNLAL